MKRPIIVITIGYLLGIIVGLYFNNSIVFFYIPIFMINYIYKKIKIKKGNKKTNFRLLSLRRYSRYVKLILTKKVILYIVLISIISNTIVVLSNQKYEVVNNFFDNKKELSLTGIVLDYKETNYYNRYILKMKNRMKIYILTNKNINLKYGDIVQIKGEYNKPEQQRNYKGFNYMQYLKQYNIYGIVKCKNVQVIGSSKTNKIRKLFYMLNLLIKEKIKKTMPKNEGSIFLGIMLGDTDNIEEDIYQNFRNASIAHILAISGLHVSYIITFLQLFLKKILGRRKTGILTILFIISYMFLTNFSPSITRAGLMAIILLFADLLYRKNDIWSSMSFSLLIIMFINPFLIQNIGVQLSYGATAGIILLNEDIKKYLKKIIKILCLKLKNNNKSEKNIMTNKIINKSIEETSISLSVQLFLFPILILNFNVFNPYFFIANFILSFVIEPIIIVCLFFLVLILINFGIANLFKGIIINGIQILIFISKIGNLPSSKIYIPTPNIFIVIIYYILLIILKNICKIYFIKQKNNTQKRIVYIIELLKYRKNKYKQYVKKLLIIFIIFIIILIILPKKFRINFIDVGQGDSTLVITPTNKTILVDGGGNLDSSFDVGEKTLLPYLLDRGIFKLDYIIVSHFDSDHVGGLLTIIKELKVETVLISKQKEKSENFDIFKKIVEQNNLKVLVVEKGDRIKIDRNTHIDILWPDNNILIDENALNNNSIVCKLCYGNFSMLFTGDIEEIAEREIIDEYRNNQKVLNSTILKVAHHGSKTSSINELLYLIRPKISLIGVGKNNKFGHPNSEVLKRLEKIRK